MNNILYQGCLIGYRCTRWTADALKRPFYSFEISASNWLITKIAKIVIMVLGLALSLVPRTLANWLNPHSYCHAKGNAEAIDVADEINVLSMNILGFHAHQAKDENRPFWEKRFESICKAIKEANADVVCLQEVHCGSWLENKLIERFKDTYSDFYGDIAPKTLMFGSGLFVMHRIKNATLDIHKFKAKTGADAKFVGKAIAVLKGKDFTVTNTHLQSGSAKEDETHRKVRWQQTDEAFDHVRKLNKSINILCGDLNENRCDSKSYKTSKLNPMNGHIIDGFINDQERKKFTQAGLNKNGSIKSQEAVDNIVAIRSKYGGKANCTLAVKQWTSFNRRFSPADHAALLAKVRFQPGNESLPKIINQAATAA